MFCANEYMAQLIRRLQETFGSRLVYAGLQGSYLRGEATEASDIDPMVVIRDLGPADLAAYRSIVETLAQPGLSCGFLCGQEELACWNALEIAQLVHGTKDFFGCLKELVPAYTADDLRAYLQLSLGNLYHELAHRRVHAPLEKNRQKLPMTAKGVFFILQGLYLLREGMFYPTRKELLRHLNKDDAAVMNLCCDDFDAAFDVLFNWCRRTLRGLQA